MSDVYVFDQTLKPATSGLIQITELDQRGVHIDMQANGVLGSLYGATMKMPSPAVPVGFWVDDTGGKFAPAGLRYLRPSAALRVEVTLLPLPSGVTSGRIPPAGAGAGSGPPRDAPGPRGATSVSPDQTGEVDEEMTDLVIRRGARWRFSATTETQRNAVAGMQALSIVAHNAHWTDEERRGVGNLISTIAAARLLEDPSEDFVRRLQRWVSWLRELGIAAHEAITDSGAGSPPVMPDKIQFAEIEQKSQLRHDLRNLEMES
jgi:hypothetical protein